MKPVAIFLASILFSNTLSVEAVASPSFAGIPDSPQFRILECEALVPALLRSRINSFDSLRTFQEINWAAALRRTQDVVLHRRTPYAIVIIGLAVRMILFSAPEGWLPVGLVACAAILAKLLSAIQTDREAKLYAQEYVGVGSGKNTAAIVNRGVDFPTESQMGTGLAMHQAAHEISLMHDIAEAQPTRGYQEFMREMLPVFDLSGAQTYRDLYSAAFAHLRIIDQNSTTFTDSPNSMVIQALGRHIRMGTTFGSKTAIYSAALPSKIGDIVMQYHGWFNDFGDHPEYALDGQPSDRLEVRVLPNAEKRHGWVRGDLVYADRPGKPVAVANLWVQPHPIEAPRQVIRVSNDDSDEAYRSVVTIAAAASGGRIYYIDELTGRGLSACVDTVSTEGSLIKGFTEDILNDFRIAKERRDLYEAVGVVLERLALIHDDMQLKVREAVAGHLAAEIPDSTRKLILQKSSGLSESRKGPISNRDWLIDLIDRFIESKPDVAVRYFQPLLDPEDAVTSLPYHILPRGWIMLRKVLGIPARSSDVVKVFLEDFLKDFTDPNRNAFFEMSVLDVILNVLHYTIPRHPEKNYSHHETLRILLSGWNKTISAKEFSDAIERPATGRVDLGQARYARIETGLTVIDEAHHIRQEPLFARREYAGYQRTYEDFLYFTPPREVYGMNPETSMIPDRSQAARLRNIYRIMDRNGLLRPKPDDLSSTLVASSYPIERHLSIVTALGPVLVISVVLKFLVRQIGGIYNKFLPANVGPFAYWPRLKSMAGNLLAFVARSILFEGISRAASHENVVGTAPLYAGNLLLWGAIELALYLRRRQGPNFGFNFITPLQRSIQLMNASA